MEFRKARLEEADEILALYRSVIGSKFCVWNEDYPGMEEIKSDLNTENLFVMTENGELIGAISAPCENEMGALPFWRVKDGNEREVSRVVVAKKFQGKGLAAVLVNSMIGILKTRGCGSVRIAAAAKNIPALKTYSKLGFTSVGEVDMYENHYVLFEKNITP